jgi:MOSC domain-containing protein YiiM
MTHSGGRIVSVNVGTPRPVSFRGKEIMTSIFKEPVAGRVVVAGINLEGDDQADRKVHGGVDKAVYAYAAEDYAWWARELDRELPPGMFGDNVTTSGIDVSGGVIGERWRVGTSLLEVAQPRIPCFKLGIRMGTQTFPRRFSQARRPGAYLRIVEAGEAGAGDQIEPIGKPEHGLTVRDVARRRIHLLRGAGAGSRTPIGSPTGRVLDWLGASPARPAAPGHTGAHT